MSAAGRLFRGCRALMSPVAPSAGGKKPAASLVTKAEAVEAKAKRGINKPVPVSDALRRFIGGEPEISRSQAVKRIWDYVKANGLQNPTNKREINCDEKLKTILAGRDKIGMFEIAKLLAPHFRKTN